MVRGGTFTKLDEKLRPGCYLARSHPSDAALAELLAVDIEGWKREAADVADDYRKFGSRLPTALEKELYNLGTRLSAATLPQKTTPTV